MRPLPIQRIGLAARLLATDADFTTDIERPAQTLRLVSSVTPVHRLSTVLATLALLVGSGCGSEHASDGAGPSALAKNQGLVIVSPASPIVSPGQEELPGDRPYFHDFGHVPYGEAVQHVFRLQNTDPDPVVVHNLLASCGCTTPRITTTTPTGEVVRGKLKGDPLITILPGAEAEVTVRVDTRSIRTFNRDKLETVRLRCDSKNTPYLSFEVHVRVERLFQATPVAIEFDNVPASVGARESARITSFARGSEAAITEIDSVEGPIRASVSRGLLLDTPIWTLLVEVDPGLPLGALVGAVHLAAVDENGEPTDSFVIDVRGQIVRDIVLDPPALHFIQLGNTASNRAEARLRALVPGSRVRVTGGTLSGPAADRLRFESVAVDPDAVGRSARWRIVLNADPSLAGTSFAGVLTLELDDPMVPTLEVPYSSRATR